MVSVENLKWVREKKKNSFEEKSDVHVALLKDGIVGIIFAVISMKQ
jgi:hypothetical protein